MTRIAIIADDLTGALDTASPFACLGAKTICFTEPDAISIVDAADADVVSVSTNSRNVSPAQAAATVRSAAESIRSLSPDVVLKKIDSRLKGHVAIESDSVAAIIGRNHLLIVPAAPDVGRYVINGAVEGAGVTQPIPVSPLFSGSTFQRDIPDVASREAMQKIARSFVTQREVLPVCSRGFAIALAEYLYPEGGFQSANISGPWLVAIGSRDPVTAEQRDKLLSASGFTCVEAPDGEIGTLPLAWHGLLLHCTGKQVEAPERVAQRFAEGVLAAIATGEPGTVLCSGGDTARAVLQTLGQTCLQVLGEAAPGLPMSRISLNGRGIVFISKSGGFGKPSTLLDLFANQLGHVPKVS